MASVISISVLLILIENIDSLIPNISYTKHCEAMILIIVFVFLRNWLLWGQ